MHADCALLVRALSSFPSLKHLDISGNSGLKVLPVPFLQLVSLLDTFQCDNCSFLLPPQSFFSGDAGLNPGRIQDLVGGRVLDSELDLSGAALTLSEVTDAASVLELYPSLAELKLCSNPKLCSAGVSCLLASVGGETQAFTLYRFSCMLVSFLELRTILEP